MGLMECVPVSGGFGVAETAGASTDDFFVDQLLDFSNALPSEAEDHPPEVPEDEQQQTAPPENSVVLGNEVFGPLTETEIPVPAMISEDLESLEWLSHFVEDSFSDYLFAGKLPPNSPETKVARPAPEKPRFVTPVQTKARTKRARTGVRVWPVLSPSFNDSSSTSSSSSASSATSFQAPKKRKKSPSEGGQPRRCSHCGVTKTPQWRAGPLGSKTLCNACGVRFKSGRLLPEYRPACSPTFSSELHSNNHRRVLEMRRKKEMESESKPAGSEF